jgi:hypothetical protein
MHHTGGDAQLQLDQVQARVPRGADRHARPRHRRLLRGPRRPGASWHRRGARRRVRQEGRSIQDRRQGGGRYERGGLDCPAKALEKDRIPRPAARVDTRGSRRRIGLSPGLSWRSSRTRLREAPSTRQVAAETADRPAWPCAFRASSAACGRTARPRTRPRRRKSNGSTLFSDGGGDARLRPAGDSSVVIDSSPRAAILLSAEFNRTATLPLTYRPGAPVALSAIKTTRDQVARCHLQKFTSTI